MWHRLADELRLREQLRHREWAPQQVFNAHRDLHVTPASQARADAVKAAWGALLPGQAVPLVGESLMLNGGCAHGESCDCQRP